MRPIFTPVLLCLLFLSRHTDAQQFIGVSANDYTGIQQMPYNPAYVTAAETGTEVNVFSVSALVGSDAYRFEKKWIYGHFDGTRSGKAIEGADYFKENDNGKKNAWGNIDVLGPAVSFKIAPNIYGGVYTRMRELSSAGNLDNNVFQFLGDPVNVKYNVPFTAGNAGFLLHTWGEAGFAFGAMLYNDDYHKLQAGVTVKYIAGFNSGSLYTKSTDIVKNTADSFKKLSGDMTVLYTSDINNYMDNDIGNDLSSWFSRNGHGSLALDIGMRYTCYSDYNPNKALPYLYSCAVSFNDIGSILYRADSGSGTYHVDLNKLQTYHMQREEFEPIPEYLKRMVKDSVLEKSSNASSFRVGLPTTFRLNFDINTGGYFYIQSDLTLNLRGSKNDVYKPAYLSQFTITPRFEMKHLMIGMPITYLSLNTMNIGTVLRVGPMFIGSATLISNALRRDLKNLDGYAGLTVKLRSGHAAHN
ncbi:hypothetical protein [Taibaiella soli]|uniref:DUF5723 domain-containing protein n=1 Tax=Taibaiella soli TaxID=1649169 RepID=A0A2W2BCG7_9BACT|nr:hypothetical protein [Taibaiella soli]PZF71356.1 hypothetical protein DN068_18865 [Taibaiella soli]